MLVRRNKHRFSVIDQLVFYFFIGNNVGHIYIFDFHPDVILDVNLTVCCGHGLDLDSMGSPDPDPGEQK